MYPPTNSFSTNKKILVVSLTIIVLFILIIVITLVANIFNNGYLYVATNQTNTANLTSLNFVNPTKPIQLKINRSNRVSDGQYILTITNPKTKATTKRIVDIESGHTSRYNIALNNSFVSPYPVMSFSPSNFVVSSAGLAFQSSVSGINYAISNNNLLSLYNNSSKQFAKVYWYSYNFAVGQTISGNLYILTPTSNSKINLPAAINREHVSVSIAPDKTIYVVAGNDIYSGTSASNFKETLSFPQNRLSVTASSKYIAVSYSPRSLPSQTNAKAKLTVLNSARQTVSTGNLAVNSSAWSPNGNDLFISSSVDTLIVNQDLKTIAVLPTNNAVDPAWINNHSLAYIINNQLWLYNLGSQLSNLIAISPSNKPILNLSVGPNKTNLYVSLLGTRNNSSANYLVRYSLNNRAVPALVNLLSEKLPWVGGFCSYDYVNVNGPSVTARSFFPQVYPASLTCQQQASTILKSIGVSQPVQINYNNLSASS